MLIVTVVFVQKFKMKGVVPLMILINGAFGVGKSTTAQALHARIANSMIYDPEEVGYLLRNILVPSGIEATGDFQHSKLWPTLTIEVARQLRAQYQRTLIVPMTFGFPEYFRQIKAGFAAFEPIIYHFCLMASQTTIHQRLAERGDPADSWSYQQTARCLAAFELPEYREYIDTELHSPAQVVDLILDHLKISSPFQPALSIGTGLQQRLIRPMAANISGHK